MTITYKGGILVLKEGIHMYQEQRLEEIIKLLEDRGSLSDKRNGLNISMFPKIPSVEILLFSQRRNEQKELMEVLLSIQKQRILGYKGRAEQSSKRKKRKFASFS